REAELARGARAEERARGRVRIELDDLAAIGPLEDDDAAELRTAERVVGELARVRRDVGDLVLVVAAVAHAEMIAEVAARQRVDATTKTIVATAATPAT